MTKEWYVVNTFSGHENKVKLILEKKVEELGLGDQICSVKIPTMEVTEMKEGKKKTKSKKFFPGYVLIEMDYNDVTVTVVRGIPGVTNFIGIIGDRPPRPLSKREVEVLFSDMGDGSGAEKVAMTVEFAVGEHVKVIDGPFGNFTGVVEDVSPEKGRLRVKVEIFGRGTPVELSFAQVEKI